MQYEGHHLEKISSNAIIMDVLEGTFFQRIRILAETSWITHIYTYSLIHTCVKQYSQTLTRGDTFFQKKQFKYQ